jgi:DNA-directed RNA polymerase specialized sigma24 family protein
MNAQDLVSYLDELLFSKTGKHINTLQMAILRGVLNGQKYADIAQEYGCSKGHAKDEAYKLWKLLSDTLGEDINKSNLRATIDRLGIANNNSQLFNPVQISEINFFPNSSEMEENDDVIRNDQIMMDAIQRKTKRETVPRLVKIGLKAEQIAEALQLPIQEVKKIMASLE